MTIDFALALYLSVTNPYLMFFESFIWKILTMPMFLLGIGVHLWAWKVFKKVKRLFGIEMDMLITEGPYEHVRHPQYSSLMLILTALTMFFNAAQLLLFTVSTAASFYIAALMEERKLEEIFKTKYLEYKRRVPQFIPFKMELESIISPASFN